MLDEIKKLMEEYSAMSAEVQPLIDLLETKKKDLAAAVMEYGKPVEHINIKAELREGYTRETWDSKALAGYAIAHPEIAVFNKSTTVKPTVAIKVL